MNFFINSKNLYKSLDILKNTTNSRFSLNDCVKFSIINNTIELSATNNENTLFAYLQYESCQTDNDNSFYIQPKKLIELLKTVKNVETLEFQTEEKNILIKNGKEKFRITREKDKHYNENECLQESGTERVYFDTSYLLKVIRYAFYTVSNDVTRENFNSLQIKVKDNILSVAGTNGQRLVKYDCEFIFSDCEYVVRASDVHNIIKILSVEENNAVFEKLTNNKFKLTTDNYMYIGKLSSEKYPDVNVIIPTNYISKILINRLALYNALLRANVLSNQTKQCKLQITEDLVQLSTQDYLLGCEGTEEIECQTNIEEFDNKFEIAVNCKYLSETLANIDTNLVEISVKSPNHVIMIKPHEFQKAEQKKQALLVIMMPLRTA